MTREGVEIARLVVGPLATNCYILSCPVTREAVIVDPGGDEGLIRAHIEREKLEPRLVLGTHGHSDHIAKAAGLVRSLGVEFAVHDRAREIIPLSVREAPLWGMGEIEEPAVDRLLADGETLGIGRYSGEIRHTPGHSPDGISIVFDGFVLVGDSLFAGSIGRTDLHGGDLATLLESIRERLLTLPDGTIAYPGHGPATTIGREREENPFLCGDFL